MTKAWDYMRSRGERERALRKLRNAINPILWDFASSDRAVELIGQGWVPVRADTPIASLGRQLKVDLPRCTITEEVVKQTHTT